MNSSTPYTSEIGAIIKQRRKQVRLTQVQFAHKAGVELRFLKELERNKPSLQMDKVNQVLKMFGLELGAVPLDRANLIFLNNLCPYLSFLAFS